MSLLRDQLAAALSGSGLSAQPPPPAAAAAPVDPHDHLLSDEGHQGSAWLALLAETLRKTPGGPPLKPKPALGQARQVHDQLGKLLKTAGRGRELRALAEARKKFESDREDAAWRRIKARLEAAGVSEKAYRSLKQEEGRDPVATVRALGKIPDDELRGMGAERLRERLG
jgi:hypothetical protein